MAHFRMGLRFNSIMNKYGLRVRKISACRSLYRNAAGYRITTSIGSFFLKPYHGRKVRLDTVYHQMTWLRKHQFQNMPLWLKTDKGTHWVKDAGRYYYVTEWIQGTHLSINEQDYERLGEALAQLHLVPVRTIRKQPGLYTRKEMHRFQQQHRLFARRLPYLQKRGSEIGRWFRNHGDICVSLAQEAWRRLGRPDIEQMLRSEKASYIHGDVTRPNVLVHDAGVYLVDWEFTHRGSVYYEIAKTLNNIADFSITHMHALLTGYERIRPFHPDERLIIASLFRLPREAWVAGRQIQFGKSSDVFARLKESWHKRIEAIQWIDIWAESEGEEGDIEKETEGD